MSTIMYHSFLNMPTLLKFLTLHALVCFFIFLAAVIPGVPITVNNEVIGLSELWSRGLGLPTAFIGLAMPVAGVLILKRWIYSRQLYALLLISMLVGPYMILSQPILVLFGILVSSSIISYLFLNKKVEAYFNS